MQVCVHPPFMEDPIYWKQCSAVAVEGTLAQISRVDSCFCVTLASVFSPVKIRIVTLPHGLIVMIRALL